MLEAYPLQIFIFPEGTTKAWEYFWLKFPYGVPGILTFIVGSFLAFFSYQKLSSVPSEEKTFRINITISFFSFGIYGLLLTVRAWVVDLDTQVLLNDILYFFVTPLAPSGLYLAYYITGQRNKILLYWSYLSWFTTFVVYIGILSGNGFEKEAFILPFGMYPKGSPFIKPWGYVSSLGYLFLILPSFVIYRHYLRANYHPALYHGINLLFFFITLNAPAILGYKVYPGGFFLFIPLCIVAYGVFRSDFLDVNELLFQKNGMFYFIFGILSFVLLSISFGVSFGLSPSAYENSKWFPYGIPPLISVFTSIFLSIIVAGANPGSRLNQLCAFALILSGFYGMQSVLLKLNINYLIQLRISQLNFLIFSFVPSVMVRLVFAAIAKPQPVWLILVDLGSTICAAFSLTPYLFYGYYDFPWTRMHHGGPIEIFIGFVGGASLLFMVFMFFNNRENITVASRSILGSFFLMSTLLVISILPSHGIPIYPMSDFQFVSAIILGYSVLKHGALSLEGRTIQLSQKLANLGLLTMGIAGLLYFPLIKDDFGLGVSAYHLTIVVIPLVLFNYLVIYIMSRPLAEELDISYFLLDLEKQKADEEREKALVMQDKAEEAREESEKLLLNILPFTVAKELKEKGSVTPVRFDKVTVLFTDFKGFTKVAEGMEERELLRELDACFTQFDEICSRNNIEKLKTIGDSYMCAGGLPVQNSTSALDACLSALEIQAFMNQLKEIKMAIGDKFWELRLGIHTGPVVAGVVGRFKFAYDIWGDAVNVASRMESSGEPGKINISHATYNEVKFFFETEYRGKLYGKNKGEMDMYFLNRLKPKYSQDPDGLAPNKDFRDIYAKIQAGAKVRYKTETKN